MVEWKNQLEGEVGSKARNLDSLEELEVPNFFVITPQEVERLFSGSRNPEEVLNSPVAEDEKKQIKDAYDDIGMSSEVRNSGGRAKNLVGGQRNGQKVTVRVSGRNRAKYEYRLNVGSSSLFDAIQEVAASYYEREDDSPAIIVQKMIEADYSGALITDYMGHGLVEAVEGSGEAIEEGITEPHFYLLDGEGVRDTRESGEQLKISRNPVNGGTKREKVSSSLPFKRNELEEFSRKVAREGYSVKFAYKRGNFYIVDAWKQEKAVEGEAGLEAIRASSGEISGRIGRSVELSDETESPEQYPEALISRKGGFTSRDAQRARIAGKPALFSFRGDLEPGQEVEIGKGSAVPRASESVEQSVENHGESFPQNGSVTATDVLPIDPVEGRGIHLSPPFGEGYSLTEREVSGENIPRDGYIRSYQDFFTSGAETVAVDARNLSPEGLGEALETLEADSKLLILDNPDQDAVKSAVRNGFDAVAVPERFLEQAEEVVAREEKRFMLQKLREIDSN